MEPSPSPSGLLDGCDPQIRCSLLGDELYFCLDDGGFGVQLCIPPTSILDLLGIGGSCGLCETVEPSAVPSATPSVFPSDVPSDNPTPSVGGPGRPTPPPTATPSETPSQSIVPTTVPTGPSSSPSIMCEPEILCRIPGSAITNGVVICLPLDTICVPREALQILLEDGYCGECFIPSQLPSLPPSRLPSSTPSIAFTPVPTATPTISERPSPVPTVSMQPSSTPTGPLDGCEEGSIEFCTAQGDIFFCVIDGGSVAQLCMPQELVPRLIEAGGFCGRCPRVSFPPSVSMVPSTADGSNSPAPSVRDFIPSAVPSGPLDGCEPIIDCFVSGGRVSFCLEFEDEFFDLCVPIDEIQDLLENDFGFCGNCPTLSPTISPSKFPSLSPLPSLTPSTSVFPSIEPTGLLDGCRPMDIEECGLNGNIIICVNEVSSCVPPTLVQDILDRGGDCGLCPTPSPTASPSDLPSITASEKPSDIPSASVSPSSAPTGIVDICDPDPVVPCDGVDPTVDHIEYCFEQQPYCVPVSAVKDGVGSGGYCGPCLEPSSSPSESPTRIPSATPSTPLPSLLPSESPSTAAPSQGPSGSQVPSANPTGALDGCDPVEECNMFGSVYMCISIFFVNDVQLCVTPDNVQEWLAIGAVCGQCPSASPSVGPSQTPTILVESASPSQSVPPSPAPSGALDGCEPGSIEPCNSLRPGEDHVLFCTEETQTTDCVPVSQVKDLLPLGFCGECLEPSGAPSIAPSLEPSSTPVAEPSSLPSETPSDPPSSTPTTAVPTPRPTFRQPSLLSRPPTPEPTRRFMPSTNSPVTDPPSTEAPITKAPATTAPTPRFP